MNKNKNTLESLLHKRKEPGNEVGTAQYWNRPDRVAQLAEHWASIPKVVGSIPTVIRHIFQAIARCGYTLRVTSQASTIILY